MSELKATPGPWRVIEKAKPVGWAHFEVAWSDYDELVCDIVYEEADAHLIAAAPEMYEALDAIVNCWDGPLYKHQMLPNIVKARAALKKARGEA